MVKRKFISFKSKRRLEIDVDDRVYFLHIGKNAGTEIKRYLAQANVEAAEKVFYPMGHEKRLKAIPARSQYFFSIRDPASRFASAFYSRKRKGRPRHFGEWTADEELAFLRFEHANDLAESLFAEGREGVDAFSAMKSITHISRNQVDTFSLSGYFLEARPPVAIIRTSHLERDMRVMLEGLGFPEVEPPAPDFVASHRNDYTGTPSLSPRSLDHLRTWFAQDYEFVRACEDWIQR